MEIKKGYKKTEIGIIPEDWECIQLSPAFVEIYNGGTPNTKIANYWNGSIKWCTPSDITKIKGKYLYTTERTITEEGLKNSSAKLLPIGTLLLCSRATIGEIRIAKIIISTNQGFKNIVTKESLNNEFLYYFLLTQKNKIIEKAIGSTFLEISKKEVSSLFAPLPSFCEQQAIATALSDVDELIGSLNTLIEKKKNIKQGTMQELLTGKKRLPGFTGRQRELRLGTICNIHKGQLITEKEVILGKVPVIAGGKKPAYYHKYANRSANTITISALGANAGYVSFHKEPIFASDCSTIEGNKDYNIFYIYSMLLFKQADIYKAQTGGAQPHIHPRDLKPLKIFFREDIEEQTAIANILSDMDEEIEKLEQKLNKYKAIKQGMMQELLTGRMRLI